jgi:hypothetical protein
MRTYGSSPAITRRSRPGRARIDRLADPPRAANELTMTVWDPVSKQPVFKTAACRVTKVASSARGA